MPEVGQSGQDKIGRTKVVVVGAGGLGAIASMYLAGAGIGHITVIDFDQIELTNLHRQVFYTENDIGKNKAEILAKKIKGLNHEVSVNSCTEKLCENNGLDLLKNADFVLDCSDNLETRYLVNDACLLLNKPFVSASIYKYEGQLAVFNHQNGPSYRCLYDNPENNADIASCNDTGVLGTLAGILGIMQANEIIKIILGRPNIVSGKVMLINVLNYQSTFMNLQRNETNFELVKKRGLKSILNPVDGSGLSISWLKVNQLMGSEEVILLDVRELTEYPRFESDRIKTMPMSSGLFHELDESKEYVVIVFCQSGIRSLQVVKQLREMGITRSFNLLGGIEDLISSDKFNIEYESIS